MEAVSVTLGMTTTSPPAAAGDAGVADATGTDVAGGVDEATGTAAAGPGSTAAAVATTTGLGRGLRSSGGIFALNCRRKPMVSL